MTIEGRVQGVFFRQSMKQAADAAGVTGWVKNLISGDVEAMVEGEDAAVERIIEWSKQGPERAAVDHIDLDELEPSGEFEEFIVRR